MAVTDIEAERAKRRGKDDEEVVDEGVDGGDASANGKGIQDRVDDGEHLEEEDDGQFTIAGTSAGMSDKAGGKRPTVSEAKMDGITLRLVGEFKKGDRVRLVVDAIVRDVQFPDDLDSQNQVKQTRRKHIFKPVAVEPQPIID